MKQEGLGVFAVGKIEDIFAGSGISQAVHTESNADGLAATLSAMEGSSASLIFTNLVDFDMLYGHRNNPAGFAGALEELDRGLPGILERSREGDLILLTADHGCDPTTPSTDHSREYVPLLAAGKGVRPGVDLGIRSTFADLGQTLAENFGCEALPEGKSFLQELR